MRTPLLNVPRWEVEVPKYTVREQTTQVLASFGKTTQLHNKRKVFIFIWDLYARQMNSLRL